MRLEQLKYLIEVANCKSINKAAQNLYITQPALSIAINSLEEELQYPLLKRTKKGVLLTEDGPCATGGPNGVEYHPELVLGQIRAGI